MLYTTWDQIFNGYKKYNKNVKITLYRPKNYKLSSEWDSRVGKLLGTGTSNQTQVQRAIDKLMTKKGYGENDMNPNPKEQCRGFANLVFMKLFNVSKITGYTNDNSAPDPNHHVGSYRVDYAGTDEEGTGAIGIGKGLKTTDTATVKNLFMNENVKVGSFLQMANRTLLNPSRDAGQPHSAILYDKGETGVTFYDANISNDNKVHQNTYTWAGLLKEWDRFSIYMPNDYTLRKDSDLGTDKDTGIIPESSFKPIQTYGDDTYYFITSALSKTTDQDHNMALTADSTKSNVYLTRRDIDVPRNTTERTDVYSRLFKISLNKNDGSYSIVNALTGKALAIPNNSKKSGVTIQQAAANSTARGQKWVLLKAPSGYTSNHFMIQNVDGMFVQPASGKATAKNTIQTAEGSEEKAQVFLMTPVNFAKIGDLIKSYTTFKPTSYSKYSAYGKGYFIVSTSTSKVWAVENGKFKMLSKLTYSPD